MSKPPGRLLYDRGWRQGCLISASLAMLLYKDLATETVEGIPQEGIGLVLATQDCDLVKPSDKLPFIEAIQYQHMTEKFVKGVMAHDARFFVLDRDECLVADRNHAVQIEKEALLAHAVTPDAPCGGNASRAARFARWLGARYDRPALPDQLVEQLSSPLGDALKKLAGPGKKYAALNADLREVRVVGDLEKQPFEVTLIFLLRADADVEQARVAVAEVLERAGLPIRDVAERKKLEAAAVHVVRLIVVPETRLPLLQYWESTPLSLEVQTYRGEDVVGAEPLRAEPM